MTRFGREPLHRERRRLRAGRARVPDAEDVLDRARVRGVAVLHARLDQPLQGGGIAEPDHRLLPAHREHLGRPLAGAGPEAGEELLAGLERPAGQLPQEALLVEPALDAGLLAARRQGRRVQIVEREIGGRRLGGDGRGRHGRGRHGLGRVARRGRLSRERREGRELGDDPRRAPRLRLGLRLGSRRLGRGRLGGDRLNGRLRRGLWGGADVDGRRLHVARRLRCRLLRRRFGVGRSLALLLPELFEALLHGVPRVGDLVGQRAVRAGERRRLREQIRRALGLVLREQLAELQEHAGAVEARGMLQELLQRLARDRPVADGGGQLELPALGDGLGLGLGGGEIEQAGGGGEGVCVRGGLGRGERHPPAAAHAAEVARERLLEEGERGVEVLPAHHALGHAQRDERERAHLGVAAGQLAHPRAAPLDDVELLGEQEGVELPSAPARAGARCGAARRPRPAPRAARRRRRP